MGALVAAQLYPKLPTASLVTWIVFCLLVLLDVGGIVTELAGVHRLGKLRLPPGSVSEIAKNDTQASRCYRVITAKAG